MNFKINENGNGVIIGKLKTNTNNVVDQHSKVVPYDIWHKGNTHLMKTKIFHMVIKNQF